MAKKPKKPLSAKKAKKILRDGHVRGKKLTDKQKRFMGLIASGKTPKKLGEVSKSDRSKIRFA